jgi:hypothetical protein
MKSESIGHGEGRMKATDVLREKAKRLQAKAAGLLQLANTLDEISRNAIGPDGEDGGPHVGVGSPAEVALWEMACDLK